MSVRSVIETDIADVQLDDDGAPSQVNKYRVTKQIGAGTFSKVYHCRDANGHEYALKILNKSFLKRKREYKRVDGKMVLSNAFQKVQREVAIMKKLSHDSLVKLHEIIDSPVDDKMFLVLELIHGGQVMYWDDKAFRYRCPRTTTGVLEKEQVRHCMRDVVHALDYLHRHSICHRDIKPENILISRSNKYKLADFGVAHMLDNGNGADSGGGASAGQQQQQKSTTLRTTEGTYHFLAPECTTGDEYDPYQADIWALGVTMFTLLHGTLPFGSAAKSLIEVMDTIRDEPVVVDEAAIGEDQECIALLKQMLTKDPCQRIHMRDLLTHPWVMERSEASPGSTSNLHAARPGETYLDVTCDEIDTAFTPVNNFILMARIKVCMANRLIKARNSLDLAKVKASDRYVRAISEASGPPSITQMSTMSIAMEAPSPIIEEVSPNSVRRLEKRLSRRSSRSTTEGDTAAAPPVKRPAFPLPLNRRASAVTPDPEPTTTSTSLVEPPLLLTASCDPSLNQSPNKPDHERRLPPLELKGTTPIHSPSASPTRKRTSTNAIIPSPEKSSPQSDIGGEVAEAADPQFVRKSPPKRPSSSSLRTYAYMIYPATAPTGICEARRSEVPVETDGDTPSASQRSPTEESPNPGRLSSVNQDSTNESKVDTNSSDDMSPGRRFLPKRASSLARSLDACLNPKRETMYVVDPVTHEARIYNPHDEENTLRGTTDGSELIPSTLVDPDLTPSGSGLTTRPQQSIRPKSPRRSREKLSLSTAYCERSPDGGDCDSPTEGGSPSGDLLPATASLGNKVHVSPVRGAIGGTAGTPSTPPPGISRMWSKRRSLLDTQDSFRLMLLRHSNSVKSLLSGCTEGDPALSPGGVRRASLLTVKKEPRRASAPANLPTRSNTTVCTVM